jgi:TPP-dependent 2-oxoacid decarboxylase
MTTTTVGRYLIHRLGEAGLRHLFGVPGDYVLDFMDRVVASDIALVGTCNELNAGYAADAYARLNGIGGVCVTYDVGGLSTLNAASGAYAERVPVVFISGAPTSAQRLAHVHMHHLTTTYDMQWKVYQKVTVDSAQVTNPLTAPDEIDRVLRNCLFSKLPVYLEIPVDMVDAPCRAPTAIALERERTSDTAALNECVEEVAAMVRSAATPTILAGVEVHRFGLAPRLLQLVEKSGIPFATTLDGKSVLPEQHSSFLGVYMGALSREAVRDRVESSDALLTFGAMATDINTGGFTAHLPEANTVRANMTKVRIRSHHYDRVWLGDFITALTQALTHRTYPSSHPVNPHGVTDEYRAELDRPLRVPRFYERLKRFIDKDMVLMTDTGDAMFAGGEIYIEEPENFISQAYYLSIGYCLPGALGVCLARPDKRVVLLEGDGAFQMTAQELSTLLRHHCNPVIFVLNNDGYVIERLIHDGPYNDIKQWNYHKLPDAFGGDALALEVRTEGELEAALEAAREHLDRLVFINLHLPRDEGSDALDRLGRELRRLQTGG